MSLYQRDYKNASIFVHTQIFKLVFVNLIDFRGKSTWPLLLIVLYNIICSFIHRAMWSSRFIHEYYMVLIRLGKTTVSREVCVIDTNLS